MDDFPQEFTRELNSEGQSAQSSSRARADDVLPSEEELITRLRRRDPAVFDQIVRTYRQQVFRFVLRSVRDRQRAEDITQDAFLKLYRHAPNLRSRERFLPWLYRAARTTVIDQQRRLQRERRIFGENGPVAHRAHLVAEPDPSLERAERADDVRKAIAELPERFRTPFVLREEEGMRYQEIADVLGIPEKTVSSRISRARNLLAARLERRYGQGRQRGAGRSPEVN